MLSSLYVSFLQIWLSGLPLLTPVPLLVANWSWELGCSGLLFVLQTSAQPSSFYRDECLLGREQVICIVTINSRDKGQAC